MTIILFVHIISALASLGWATYAFFAPSGRTLKVSYGLTLLTLASGTYLAWSWPAHLAQACASGLIYLGAVSASLAVGRRKLARAAADRNRSD
jgi:hypothetical protein